MAKPYESPMDRKRMSGPVPDESPAPDEGEGSDEPAPSESGEEGAGGKTEFLPKDFLGGTQYKPGDTVTLVVRSVDPETGEVEVTCSPVNRSKTEEAPSVQAMDEAMGPE